MSLSTHVEALLEVYSKCLGLLHVFGGSKKRTTGKGASAVPSHASDVASDWDRQSRLARSLQSDRAKVRKVFSSRLSETGTRLAKGDTRSRSALRRIIHRLTEVLSNIFNLGTQGTYAGQPDGQPLLNYDALRALSNASRIGAIHTIDDLSVRLKQRAASRAGTRSGQSNKSARLNKEPPSIVTASNKAGPSTRASAHKASNAAPPRTGPRTAPLRSAARKSKHTKTKQEQGQQLLPPAVPANSSTTRKLSSSHDASKRKGTLRPPVASGRATIARKQDAAAKASKPSKTRSKQSSKTKHGDKGKKPAKEGSKTSNPSRPSLAEPYAAAQVPPEYAQPAPATNSPGSTTSTARAGPLHGGVHLDSGSKPNHPARRLSMLSSSSASTRLGEIPTHKLRRRNMGADAQDGSVQDPPEYYNIRPAYPMRPLWVPDDSQAGPKGHENRNETEKKPDDRKKRFWERR